MTTTRRFDTLAVHAGEAPDPQTGALDPPVTLASAYAFRDAADAEAQFTGEREGFIYGRWRNPSVQAFESKVASLEGAEAAAAFASGMAAITATLSSLVEAGDEILASASIYAETARLLAHLRRFGVDGRFVDTTDIDAVEAAWSPRVKVLYVETPSNPALALSDLAALSALAHARGALVVVDGTFATPYHQRPLALGADLSLHSATKGLCGHGDAIGGVVSGAEALVAATREIGARTLGGSLAPLSAMLLARGLRTLSLRMARASESAFELARRLDADPRIASVAYPGLPSHPQHALARRQMERGFGALVAFEVRGGRDAGARAYDALQVISRAVSLGDVRSLITHPASTTHASLSAAQRELAGIGEGLMRLSVGIEDVEDLWEDLDRALGG